MADYDGISAMAETQKPAMRSCHGGSLITLVKTHSIKQPHDIIVSNEKKNCLHIKQCYCYGRRPRTHIERC